MPDARAMMWEGADEWDRKLSNHSPVFHDSEVGLALSIRRLIALARQERERAERYKETALLETGLREAAEAEIHAFKAVSVGVYRERLSAGDEIVAMREEMNALRALADALAGAVEGYKHCMLNGEHRDEIEAALAAYRAGG